MTSDLRDADAALGWLGAGLVLVRVGDAGDAAIREATPWLRAFAADVGALPPPGVVVDLGRLVSLTSASIRPRTDGPLADVLRAYDDQVLGRLASDPLREAASDAIRGVPTSLRADAVALFVDQVLERVGFDGLTALDPGALRELDRRTGDEWVALGHRALATPTADALARGYQALIGAFQRTGRPIHPADVATLAQLPVLRLRSERLALRQVLDAAQRLAHGLPARLRPSRRRDGHVATRLEDESAYPVGGFTAISTSGSPENLVISELATMEDGAEIDLFDVRYAEGELLYYTRDESVIVRPRRRFTLVLDPALEGARFRDAGLPYQRLVLALGVVVAVVEHLAAWLSTQDLRIRVTTRPGALDAEMRLLSRALASWVEAGVVTLEPLDPAALDEAIAQDDRSGPTDVLGLGDRLPDRPGRAPARGEPWRTDLAVGARPALSLPFSGRPVLAEEPWAAWREVVGRVLPDLV